MRISLQTRWLPLSAVLCITIVQQAVNLDAATVTMVNTNASGESWATAGDWSNSQAASSSHDYVVNANFQVRPVQTGGSQTFPGLNLTLNGTGSLTTDGTLGLAQDTNSTTNVANLFVNGGVIVATTNGLTQTLAGSLTFGGPGGTIRTGGNTTAARNITVASSILGSGTITAYQRGTILLTGSGNSFAGTWSIGGLTNSATLFTTFDAQSANSLGTNSSVNLNAFASLDVDYDWSTSGSLTLNTNGVLILDQALTVGSLTIGGSPLGAGNYSFSFLNTNYDAFFQNGGSGSITVVPEPSIFGLFLLGAVGMMALRRRPR